MARNITVSLKDRPGSLAELGETLWHAGINIVGLCGVSMGTLDSQDVYTTHLVVDDHDQAEAVLRRAGYIVRGDREVLVEDFGEGPRAAGAFFRKLADANVNVDLCYLTADGRLVVGVNDIEAARKAIS
jgi:hypothetical protein